MRKGQRSIHVLMHPDDLKEFDDWLRNRGDTVAYKSWSESEGPEPLSSVCFDHSRNEPLDVLLAPQWYRSSLYPQQFVLGRGYRPETTRAPLLDFRRCYFDARTLRSGTLSGCAGFWRSRTVPISGSRSRRTS